MEETLEQIEFLARSENRVAVLRLLAQDGHTRSMLAAETGASQATLSRILGDFEDRSWITRRDGRYRTTPTGQLVADGLSELIDVVALEAELRPIVSYLPTEQLSLPLQQFVDATVVVPSATRPDAPISRLLEFERSAETIRAVSHAFNERSLSLVAKRVKAGDLAFEGVFSQSAIDALAADTTLREQLLSVLDSETAAVRVSTRDVPVAVTIADRTVHLLVRDDSGVLRASIDADTPAVVDWATETFETFWEDSEPIQRSSLFE